MRKERENSQRYTKSDVMEKCGKKSIAPNIINTIGDKNKYIETRKKVDVFV